MKKSYSDTNIKKKNKSTNTNDKTIEEYKKKIDKLKQEIANLNSKLIINQINETSSIIEDKYKLLQEENALLNKKLQCYISENTLLKGKINSLTEIINQNEKYRKELSNRSNPNRFNYLNNIESTNQSSLKDTLLDLNNALDVLTNELSSLKQ